jgi:predicted GIY-YIG superfamily endonuclease
MAHHRVYIVELEKDVAGIRKFMEANPDYQGELPCLYVGVTGLSPEQRFQNHKSGTKASRFVQKYGFRLRPDLYAHIKPTTYKEAAKTERRLARQLRAVGYGVWQN